VSNKFKVGDKVRCVNVDAFDIKFKNDDEYIIYKIDMNYRLYRSNEMHDYCDLDEVILVKEENSDITKDLKKAIGFLDLHDKDKFMLDNIVATLEDRIDEIRRT
jgi:hypothetical protein